MSGKGLTADNDLLKYIYNATTPSWGSNTNLYVALHTADPTSSGTQTSSEATYTGYARVAVVRTSAGWTVNSNQVSNAALITFPQNTGSSQTVTHVTVGTASAGAGEILYFGPVTSGGSITAGLTPVIQIGQLVIQET